MASFTNGNCILEIPCIFGLKKGTNNGFFGTSCFIMYMNLSLNCVLELYPFICMFSVLVFSFANTSITEHVLFV